MKIYNSVYIVLILLTACSACNKETESSIVSAQEISNATTITVEGFETGTKTSYTTGNVTLTTGSWNFDDALIGNSGTDVKDGSQSARIRDTGKLTMNFNFTSGSSTISIKHATFGSDGSSTWQLWYSTNNGSTYTETGSTITTSSSTLQTSNFTLKIQGNIRFQLRKISGGSNRINIDDFSVTSYGVSSGPVITSLTPDTAITAGKAFTVVARGTGFLTGSVVNWNGTALTTTYISKTKIKAKVPATDIAAAGLANITITNSKGTSAPFPFYIISATTGTKRFLFDATKAETAGNADWVIDEDNSKPQQIPTPTQSNITSSTSETYWTGALSSWGVALVKSGDYVETLPSSRSITYGNSSNPQDLSNYDVFVVDEPNTLFTSTEKTAIINFVNHGGGLFMISDHTQSDRNNDGYDSPGIWNDLMTNNSVQNNPFGFSIDLTNVSGISSNVLSNSTGNVILNGSQGSVSKLEFNNGATISLQPSANSSVQGLIWQSGYTQNTTHIMCASSTYGNGRVFVVTDSSPMDDGTGASGNTLYVSWNLYSHTQLFMNASLWLAKQQ